MTQRNGPAGWEFPGVPTLLCVAAIWVAIWPWQLLHGVARFAVGIPWTAVAVLIAVGVIAGKVRQHRTRRA